MGLIDLFLGSFEKGGIIMWPILGVSIVSWYIGLDRLFFLNRLGRARERFWCSVSNCTAAQFASVGMPAYDTLLKGMGKVRAGTYSLRHLFHEFLISSAHEMERGFSTMSAWIATAPLLGLLGTVAGMIHTFRIIMEFGIGNPHLMAEGISIALLTTQAGLTVAFPALLFHNFLWNRKNRLMARLIKDGEDLMSKWVNG